MDRTARLSGLWSWLPAFRAVAETEHLPTAAKHLHVSASALSRSVKQLEAALGIALFRRQGRHLVLAPAGQLLLEDVREAMRRIDDGIARAGDEEAQHERVRVAAQAPWIGALVAPALAGMPVTVEHVAAAPERVDAMLLRGELDLAIGGAATTDGQLLVERLGEIAIAIACARRHRLARTTRGEVLDATRFAVCPEVDAWPGERSRRVALVTSDLGAVLDACASGDLAAIVPAALARRRGLHVVKAPGFPGRPLYLTRRRPLRAGWLDSVAGAIRGRAQASALDARR